MIDFNFRCMYITDLFLISLTSSLTYSHTIGIVTPSAGFTFEKKKSPISDSPSVGARTPTPSPSPYSWSDNRYYHHPPFLDDVMAVSVITTFILNS